MKESEEKYKILVQTIPDIVYEIDAEGRFTFLSDAIKELGYNPKELIGKYFREILHPDDFEAVSRAILLPKYKGKVTGDEGSPKLFDERRTELRMTRNLEARLVLKNRQSASTYYRHMELSSSGKWNRAVQNKNKKLLGSIGIMRDITERKKIDRMKDNLIRDVSHGLKTPIAMVEMAYDICQQGIRNQNIEQIKTAQRIASNNIRKLQKDVDSIVEMFALDKRSIKDKKKKKKKKKVSLKEIIDEVIDGAKHLIVEKRLKLKIDIPKEIDGVLVDKRDMKILMNNIIDNAIKFTEHGSISITSRLKEKWVEIKVKDIGHGIAPKNKDKVFDRFYKRHPANEGTGLGLTICKEILDIYNGEIKVVSKGLGKGTTVIVNLPKR